MATGDVPAAVTLGNFVSGFRYDDLPPAERAHTKSRVLYLLGTVLSARVHRGSQLALAMVGDRTPPGPSSVWLSGRTAPTGLCAFANSVLAHAGLLDDTPAHTGAVVVPAAIAVAEAERRTGAATLAAIALGYELTFRIDSPQPSGVSLGGSSLAMGLRHSWFAVFGATVAAGYLYQLPACALASALALTTTLGVPGAMAWSRAEPDATGGASVSPSERLVQIAANSQQGVLAAELARCGFAGTPTALEGDAGLYSIYTGVSSAPAGLLDGLGTTWHFDQIGVKPYPGVGSGTPTYCAEKLVRGHAPVAEHVRRVELRTPLLSEMPGMVDTGPFVNVEQALGSYPFAVAATFVFGKYDWEVIAAAVGDARVDALASKIEVRDAASHTEPSVDSRSSWLEVVFDDGHTITTDSADMPPHLARLETWDSTVAKFERLAHATPDAQRRRIVEEVWCLDEREDCRDLLMALAAP